MLRREGILFDNIRLTRRTDPVSELRSSPIFEPDFPKASYDESMSEARAWLKRNRGASEDVVLQFGRGLDVFYNWAINMSTAAGADGRDGQALVRQRAFFRMDYCINSNSELEACTAVRTKEVQMEITSLKGDDFTALDASRVVKNDFSVGRKLELIQRPDFVEVGTKTYSNWDECSSKCVHPADEGQYNATCRPKFDRSYLIENGFCFPPLEEGDTIVCLRVNEDLGGYIGIVAYLASGQDDVGSVEYDRVEPDSGSRRLIWASPIMYIGDVLKIIRQTDI
ncbi:unnamed protein product [Chondrus crispus]|uniref:Uncharacterized protein n=1 Tax=Chondrus crispus TaxID=2769 RepID=R7Q500_CHOCR|nr:unnamed protein product [Chondrus crispus]CDF32441.1 unnamed protein product [Chondrus crispus]|eukprot:XP_005712106.1 unnamed protein product [Chondrus crispus]